MHRVPETVVPDKRLGRNIEKDDRNKNYPAITGPIRSVMHHLHGIPLGQGNERSCVGFTMANLMMTDPFYIPGRVLTEEDALALYGRATTLDNIKGDFPGEDTGTTTLGASKALVEAGLVSEYRHAETTNKALGALTLTPLFFGMSWYDSFDTPAPDGEIRIEREAGIRGGHAVELIGLNVDVQRVWGLNPWGRTWGLGGMFWMSFDTFDRLVRGDGDVTQFVPTSGTTSGVGMDNEMDDMDEMLVCPECGAPTGAPPDVLLESRRWASRRWASRRWAEGQACGTCGAPVLDSRRWASRRWASRRWAEEPEQPLESRRWASRRWAEGDGECPKCGRKFLTASAYLDHASSVHGHTHE